MPSPFEPLEPASLVVLQARINRDIATLAAEQAIYSCHVKRDQHDHDYDQDLLDLIDENWNGER